MAVNVTGPGYVPYQPPPGYNRPPAMDANHVSQPSTYNPATGQGTPPVRQEQQDAYERAMAAWRNAKEIESRGGPPAGDAPAPPVGYETQDESALRGAVAARNAAIAGSASNYNGVDPETGISHTAYGGGGVPGLPGYGEGVGGPAVTPSLSTGERAGYSLDDAQGQQIRQRQVGYLDALTARANGQGPSVAGELAKAQQSTIARNALGVAAQARGADAAAARRAAIQGIAQVGGQAAQQAGILRATEQTQAQDQLGNQLFGVRGQDTGVATHVADQTLGATTGNLDRESGERVAGGGQAVQREGIAAGERTSKYAVDRGRENQSPWWFGPTVGALGTAGAGLLMKSDERAKENITDAGPGDWLDHLVAKDYDYKDPADGLGRRRGVMAQDLEKSDVGRAFVVNGADGHKRVDAGGLTLALVAEVARMRRDMKKAS